MKIGFFDSGLGGLLVMRATAKALPEYDYEYYGDTAHLPYGDKTEREIYELTKSGAEHLFSRGCALVIIACNTASAETLRTLQDEYLPQSPYADRKILGVIIPMVEAVVESDLKRVLLLATKRTVSSGKYHLELGKRNVLRLKIESVASPELVPLIEAGNLLEADLAAANYVLPRVGEVDGLVLGCTHYALLKDALRAQFGAEKQIFSPDEIIPEKISAYLAAHPEIESKLTREGTRNIFLTEQKQEYDVLIERFLSGKLLVEA